MRSLVISGGLVRGVYRTVFVLILGLVLVCGLIIPVGTKSVWDR